MHHHIFDPVGENTLKKLHLIAITAILALVYVLAVRLPAVSAHEAREVGPYIIEFGLQVERAYAGVYNGPEIYISLHDDETQKVEGAEETLLLTVMFGGQSKVLKLEPAWQDPGHYVASMIPTRPGDYSFRLTGKIGDTDVDETFSS